MKKVFADKVYSCISKMLSKNTFFNEKISANLYIVIECNFRKKSYLQIFPLFFIPSRGQYTIFPHTLCGK